MGERERVLIRKDKSLWEITIITMTPDMVSSPYCITSVLSYVRCAVLLFQVTCRDVFFRLIDCNCIFLLCSASLPTWMYHTALSDFTTFPFYTWLASFTLRPHSGQSFPDPSCCGLNTLSAFAYSALWVIRPTVIAHFSLRPAPVKHYFNRLCPLQPDHVIYWPLCTAPYSHFGIHISLSLCSLGYLHPTTSHLMHAFTSSSPSRFTLNHL